MRCTCILSAFGCSLFARSANHGPLIFTDDGFEEPPQAMNTGAGANGNGNGGATYGDGTSGTSGITNTSGGTQTGMGKDDSPLVLPLVTGGILFILLWALWFGWRWYEGRGGSGEGDEEQVEGEREREGESGRISTRMNAVPPKLWEVEIYHHYHAVGPLAVSLDDDEEVHEHEVGKVRASVLSAFEFMRD